MYRVRVAVKVAAKLWTRLALCLQNFRSMGYVSGFPALARKEMQERRCAFSSVKILRLETRLKILETSSKNEKTNHISQSWVPLSFSAFLLHQQRRNLKSLQSSWLPGFSVDGGKRTMQHGGGDQCERGECFDRQELQDNLQPGKIYTLGPEKLNKTKLATVYYDT